MNSENKWLRIKCSVWRLFGLTAFILGNLLPVDRAHPEVATDGSLRGTAGPVPPGDGYTYNITQDLGTVRGQNLFHSFSQFSIGADEIANFSSTQSFNNVISRVTGGEVSSINGILASTIEGADLYLMNPAGVMFGADAQLDVRGSFHVTTADYLRFADDDDTRFNANPGPTDDVLSVEPVEAFGFLTSSPASISVGEESTAEPTLVVSDPEPLARVHVPTGNTLSMVGGNINILGRNVAQSSPDDPAVHAPGGVVNVVSVAAEGEVDLDTWEPGTQVVDVSSYNANQLGVISLSQRAAVSSSGDPAGLIVIRGGSLTLVENSRISTNNLGSQVQDQSRGGIDIEANEIELGTEEGIPASRIETFPTFRTTPGEAPSNPITIKASNLTLNSNSHISSKIYGEAKAGNITLQPVDRALYIELAGDINAGIREGTSEGGGSGGNITIEAGEGDLMLAGRGSVTSASVGTGDPGKISITARNITVEDTADISTIRAFSTGQGVTPDAGQIKISATESVILDGEGNIFGNATEGRFRTGILSDSIDDAIGDAGSVFVEGKDVVLRNGALISARTNGSGEGGDVTVIARNELMLDGFQQLAVTFPGQADITQISRSSIRTETSSAGRGGNINITASSMSVSNGALVSAASSGSGIAGNLSLNIGTLTIQGGGEISTSTAGFSRGGRLTIRGITGEESAAESLTIFGQDSPILFTPVSTSGTRGEPFNSAGRILSTTGVREGEFIEDENSIELVQTNGTFPGGDIDISVGALNLFDGAEISAESFSSDGVPDIGRFPDAGGITLSVETLEISTGASISSSATTELFIGSESAVGAAGQVRLQGLGGETSPATKVVLNNGVVLTEAEAGAAGDIVFTADEVTLTGASISSSVLDGERGAGSVLLNTSALDVQDSQISSRSASGATGNAGRVIVSGLAGEGSAADWAKVFGGGLSTSAVTGAGGDIAVTAGDIVLQEGGIFASVTGGQEPGGSIELRAGTRFDISGSDIEAESFGDGEAGDITLAVASGPLTVNVGADGAPLSNSTRISTSSAAAGRAGNISVTASELTVANAAITTEAIGSGAGGSIEVVVDGSTPLRLTDTVVSAEVNDVPNGTELSEGTGSITFSAPAVEMSGESEVTVRTKGSRDAGIIVLESGMVDLSGAALSASSESGATGFAGAVSIKGLDGGSAQLVRLTDGASLTSTAVEGGAGRVLVTANDLLLQDATVSTTSEGAGEAGIVSLNVASAKMTEADVRSSASATGNAGRVEILGLAGDETAAEQVDIRNSQVTTEAVEGLAGDIQVSADELTLTEATISSTVSDGERDAGGILLNASTLDVQDSVIISSSMAAGRAGNIDITASELSLANAEVNTTATATGAGGSIDVVVDGSAPLRLIDTTVSAEVNDVPNGTELSEGTGRITFSAPAVEMSGESEVTAKTTGTQNAGAIFLDAATVELRDVELTSSSEPGATGDAGSVIVRGIAGEGSAADWVKVIDGGLSTNAVEGEAGRIEVSADEVTFKDAALSSAVVGGEKDAGRVSVNAPILTMAGSTVSSETEGAGDAGSVFLNVDTLKAQGSQITSSSTALGSGQPGSITIMKTGSGPADRVTLTDSEILTQIQGAEGGRRPTDAEDVGQIKIIADTLRLDGSRISGTTAGIGDASVMRLWANEFALQGSEISSSTSAVGDTPGDAGQIFIRGAQGVPSIANQLALVDSEIRTGTTGGGFGGEIQMDVVDVSLSEGSEISASTASAGSAGDIRAEVGNLSSQDSLITSVSTSAAADAGTAGSITLTAADSISIDNGGLTTVANGGAGGSIDVGATNTIALAATEVLATVLGGDQPGGDVTLNAREILLTDGTAVAAESEGTGTAGAVAIGDAGTASLRLENSTVSTNAAEAKGGDINLQAQEIVHLTDSGITTSVGAGEGQGGNIFIDPQYVILNRSRVQANAVGGPGGRIEIDSDIFIASADSVVEAVSETNIEGVVLITAPERDVVSGTSVLPAEFQDPSRRLRASCGQRVDVGRSNFQEVGLEGLPPSPDDYLWVTPLLPVAEAGGELGSVVFFEPATTVFSATPCGKY